MDTPFKRISHPMTLIFFVALFLLVFFSEKTSGILLKQLPAQFYTFNTIFLSMLIESLPFLLIGVIVSALIQAYLKQEWIQHFFSGRRLIAMIPAAFTGILFPICECAIIPVIRSLIKKGLPQHIGVVMIAAIPVLNPVVFLSTFYAFQGNSLILYTRMSVALLSSLFIGAMTYYWFGRQSIVKGNAENNGRVIRWKTFYQKEQYSHHEQAGPHHILLHISNEFFDTAKYFIFGALIASSFQTFFNQQLLTSVAANPALGTVSMMGLAYLLSVCSTSDAFLAASFSGTFPPGALTAFLVFGAMLDIKNTMMLLSSFKLRFVAAFFLFTFGSVFVCSLVIDYLR
ncbi:permease [Sporolactobacillus terrae]|uniref:Permease n=1 Tax=Sporolactobacillus terrae TaxID=269673 RepID=A0A5K7X4J1_9BACL|nr:permease [Sporolactobacillus terrae]BBN99573.1 permease [Sporolactobacillus terrae]